MSISKNHIALQVNNWSMIGAKKVSVVPGFNEKGHPFATINVNDGELIHDFSVESRVSKALLVNPAEAIAERFTGGQFFTINDTLVDMRDGHYNGFTHDVQSIQQLIDIIGVTALNGVTRGIKHETTQGNILLSNEWGNQHLDIAEYQEGGQFSSRILYNWSPFSQSIRGVFELVRLICTNGMVGMTDFFNARIPVINRWEEHMDIAYGQIQNKVQGRVQQRISEMGTEPATVGELLQITQHATKRLNSTMVIGAESNRLRLISEIADPRVHLGSVYRHDVFDDKSIAARVPGHISSFDAWNLVTEMYSHTKASDDSSDIGLQRMANALVFDSEGRNKRMLNMSHPTRAASSFLDPKQAFYGVMM